MPRMKHHFFLIFLVTLSVFGQESKDTNALEVSFFRGNIIVHSKDLYHLQGHSESTMISLLKQTHGSEEWQSSYNFPDYGVYFQYQNFNNDFLGKIYSAGLLYNFYFLNRNLKLNISQGIAYATNPYDKIENSKNKSFGSKLLGSTNFGLFYKKENVLNCIGFQTGFLFSHNSNGRIKSPNIGINTFLFNVGLNYNFSDKKNEVATTTKKTLFSEPIKYNISFRLGANESPIIGSGQYPFYHLSFFADKRFNRKSALQLGAEIFVTNSIKDYIKFKSVAYPELHLNPNTDFKRVGVFVGYELFVNKVSLEAQLGYYCYKPFKNDSSIYDRVGLKYYINPKLFTSFSVKTHLFLAEALEFGVGVRL